MFGQVWNQNNTQPCPIKLIIKPLPKRWLHKFELRCDQIEPEVNLGGCWKCLNLASCNKSFYIIALRQNIRTLVVIICTSSLLRNAIEAVGLSNTPATQVSFFMATRKTCTYPALSPVSCGVAMKTIYIEGVLYLQQKTEDWTTKVGWSRGEASWAGSSDG